MKSEIVNGRKDKGAPSEKMMMVMMMMMKERAPAKKIMGEVIIFELFSNLENSAIFNQFEWSLDDTSI